MAFEEVVFPAALLAGSSGGPTWDVDVIEYGQTNRYVNTRVPYPIYRFTLTHNLDYDDVWQQIIEFFSGLNGPEVGFLFPNWFDNTSLGPLDAASVTYTDIVQPLPSGSPLSFQLTKTYTTGTRVKSKPILKPKSGTVKVGWGGAEKTEGVDWSVDLTTGVVTILIEPSPTFSESASPVLIPTAGFEFYTPCALAQNNLDIIQFNSTIVGNITSLPLVELLSPT